MSPVATMPMNEHDVKVPLGPAVLEGNLSLPADARGLVLFAHGSGSSRHSPRNRYVARRLNDAGLATLLVDLLTPEEERIDEITAQFRFNIVLLADRLVRTTDWLQERQDTSGLQDTSRLRLGYFGASTGAGAALAAAAERRQVRAVVSRGGRPDLAGPALPRVEAPTLLIVGGADREVIALNRTALTALRCEKEIAIISGATHLFQEPGALDDVADLAARWLLRHLAGED
ncbi:hydrolase [Roseomonas hellenica]|uniref:Hydrolase n=1 Tax=Plastoroseomonas hellenica TaxID=2687306 RepID=A0ABS5EYW9_9PROT|nr:dienelactone hydrolase family protein [Plastoroseomonas hellenica]MBR0665496.1 hydrolase [Plastoroseomonas hellenica]